MDPISSENIVSNASNDEDFEDEYDEDHENNNINNNKTTKTLGLWQGVALLTADCLGVGILALPQDIHVLGWVFGLGFLLVNLPINYYAGSILAWTALQVEKEWDQQRQGVAQHELADTQLSEEEVEDNREGTRRIDGEQLSQTTEYEGIAQSHVSVINEKEQEPPTADLIGISAAVLEQHCLSSSSSSSSSKSASTVVLLLYYLNLFLVLGDYILVMSHAVAAIWGEDNICLTTAGLIASTLMFVIAQLNTMALLGQYVSIASLLAMMVVLGQCIYETHQNNGEASNASNEEQKDDSEPSLLRKFSALASICFAVGSQKLFLNIRFELGDKTKHAAPVLARSLTIYGMAYVFVVVFSGTKPPSFLFDAIPRNTWNRRIAGLLLWAHVSVSYAINSCALCSSLDRLLFHVSPTVASTSVAAARTNRMRWISLTFVLAVLSYLVANGIPFFKDLVALIGAATTVPLTLTLPPVLYQHWQRWTHLSRIRGVDDSLPSDNTQSWSSVAASALLLYSIVFLGIGLAGALASVKQDWAHENRPPFSCSHS